jgi:acetyl-CoA synthetase
MLQAFLQARDTLLAYRSDYAQAKARFRWPELDQFNWALDHFDTMARGNTQPALRVINDDGSSQQVSFEVMRQRSNQVAHWLESLGVRRGDRILLMLGNEVALWELMLACIKIGAVMIPATSLLTRDDLMDRIERGAIKHVATHSSQSAKFDGLMQGLTGILTDQHLPGWHGLAASQQCALEYSARAATHANDPLLLYFTSGTTSKPKLVQHTHQSYPVGHLSTMYWLGLKPGDIHWNISSPGWGKHAWSCFFAPWIAGACVFIFNYARFDGPRVLKTLVDHQVTSLCAPPTVWRMLIQEDLAAYPVKLRELISAGEPLNPEVIEQVRSAWGITIRDGFGQTETTCVIGNSPGQHLKFGSMGRPMPGFDVVLLDPQDQPADEGEICLRLDPRPVGLMPGYADAPEKNAEVMRDGFYRTGDVASRDAEGYITYVGRADDVFKASDYRISPFELESLLIEHPAVAEAAVVPSPDPLRLAVPKAFVTLAPGVEPSEKTALEILQFCRDRLAPYKRIRRLEFASLPKTISGKIRRVELRNQEARRPMPASAGPNEVFDDRLKDG